MGRVFLILATLCALTLPAQDRTAAERLYNRTDYDGALSMLRGVQRPDAGTLGLMGRCAFMQGDFHKATDYLEKAAALEPNSSEYALWLGRAWGRRAETASPLFAPMHASKARRYFERALELDPHNRDAMTDLFDYYLEAPGFLGGGFDKAEAIARRISKTDPAEYQYELAQLAKKRSQFGQAEEHLRRAIELAPHQVGRMVDLAKFLARQGRMRESEAELAQAERIAPGDPRLLYDRASIYVEQHQKLNEARQLLQRYLHSNLTPDDPPRDAAERLLKQAAGA